MADQGRARGRTRARAQAQPEQGRRPGQPLEAQPQRPPGGRGARGAAVGETFRPGGGVGESVAGKHAQSDPGSVAKRQRSSEYPVSEEPVAGPSTEAALAATVSGITLRAGDNGGRASGRGAWRGRGDHGDVTTRPAHIVDKRGTSGQAISLVANYFKLSSTPNWAIYHYHVDFSPDVEGTRVRRALFAHHKAKFGSYLFDGMAMFTSTKLDEDELDLFSERKGTEDKIRIHLKLIKELPPSDPILLQICNIQMRRNLRHLKFSQLGRYYFDMHEASSIPRHNLELWPGFITAIHQHEASILLCADLTFKILRCDTVLEQLEDFHRRDPNNFRDNASKALIGAIVLARYSNKTYRIDDIEWDLSPQRTFDLKDGSKVSYVDYYKNHWNLNIKDLRQPMLISRPKKRDAQRGAVDIMLVPELCVMTGLTEETRSDFNVMRDIATHTRVGPDVRVDKLNRFMGRLQSNAEVQKEMQGWAISFSRELVNFGGRNLQPEKIFQAGNKSFTYDAATADWSREMRSNRLFYTVGLRTWALIVTRRDENNAHEFVGALSRVGPPMGIEVGRPQVVPLQSDRLNDYVSALQRVIAPGLQLVVCIVPNNRKDRYDAIKKRCCVDSPVPSQVVQGRTISKRHMMMSVATKIAIQLNCKLGGSAWTVELPLKNIMVVGYDSYHDSSKKGLSVGAICCSLNAFLTKYHSRVAFQTSHQEMVEGFQANLSASLKKYSAENGQLPDRIFVYRDGVGEGQLQAVRDFELQQIQECFKRIGGYEPRLAFIVVSKRINTRLFERQGGNYRNPLPGTVADSEITRPEFYDFFLVSQSVRQGTVSPTHYNVIYDTTGLKPDHVQRLTYKLTHLYYNWPGTVRVPAPCLYAHKLAFLTGQSLHAIPSLELADTLFFL